MRKTKTEIEEPQIGEEKKKWRILVVEKLYDDYLNDPELTAFTSLDSEDFFLHIQPQ